MYNQPKLNETGAPQRKLAIEPYDAMKEWVAHNQFVKVRETNSQVHNVRRAIIAANAKKGNRK